VTVRGIHHLGVAVADLDEALATYSALFGARVEHRSTVPDQGVDAMSLLVGGATMVSGTISATIAGALPTAVYIELRGLKEGPEAHGLDAVFA